MSDSVVLSNDILLIHGDCQAILETFQADMSVVTDPPYGIGHFKGQSGSTVRGRRSLRRSSHRLAGDDKPFDPSLLTRFQFLLIWGANHYASRLPTQGRWLAWDKTGGGRGPKDSFSDVEFAWANTKGNAKLFHYLWKGVCQDGEKGERRHHPTQKPIALMEWCIGYSPADTTILDPYMGAGSTGIAAVRQGRPFIGIELERDYFDRAVQRISAEVEKRKAAA